uniref:Transthyretin/hydroxyisourate hydrolase domain-containing protein n=1 Tax=Sinocyclocheilus anshuiensis TaxID=1608454 RepID=A0A671P0K2_9TELE
KSNKFLELKVHLSSNSISMGPSVKSSSPITTHVLNTGDWVPAARVALSLHRLDPRMAIWSLITIGWEGLITSDGFTPGIFYPYVEVCKKEYDADQSFHVPLLVSRYSYSTYRGS